MDVKVRCCSLTKPAADSSIIPENVVAEYLNSEDYRRLIDGKLGLGSLTHRIRSIETASDSIGNTAFLKKTVGKDDLGLIVSDAAPTFTHYVTRYYIDDYNGDRWLCANLHILDPDGFDSYAQDNINRLRAFINQGIKLTCSLVVVAYWDNQGGQDYCRKIKTIKSCDFTCNPSFGPEARIFEVTDDRGKVIDKEKNYSAITKQDGMKVRVKTFSDISNFGLTDLPKTSKIDGYFTQLKVKEYSYTGVVTEDVEEKVFTETDTETKAEQKQFTATDVKNRLREAKLSPRMYFRRVYISYKQAIKALAGSKPLKEQDAKILKSLFTSDILFLMNEIQPEILKGKQINTLLGCSSVSKVARIQAQKLQLPFRMAMIEVKRQGFLSKIRYQKLQQAYMDFINGLIEDVFGPNSEPIPEEENEEGGNK